MIDFDVSKHLFTIRTLHAIISIAMVYMLLCMQFVIIQLVLIMIHIQIHVC